jgi:hypothetical protein
MSNTATVSPLLRVAKTKREYELCIALMTGAESNGIRTDDEFVDACEQMLAEYRCLPD